MGVAVPEMVGVVVAMPLAAGVVITTVGRAIAMLPDDVAEQAPVTPVTDRVVALVTLLNISGLAVDPLLHV